MSCAFCGNPVTLEAVALPAQLRPEAILPFQIDKRRALELFSLWIKGLWFTPIAFTRLATTNKIVGVYRPYWTYDSYTDSWYSGERGSNPGIQQKSTQTWAPASGCVPRFFNDVLVFAGKDTEWKTQYNLKYLQAYDASCLAGWSVERYSIPPEEGWNTAKEFIDLAIQGEIRNAIGGNDQRIHDLRTSYNAVRFKHILRIFSHAFYRHYRRNVFLYSDRYADNALVETLQRRPHGGGQSGRDGGALKAESA
jgi:hypothetical protein